MASSSSGTRHPRVTRPKKYLRRSRRLTGTSLGTSRAGNRPREARYTPSSSSVAQVWATDLSANRALLSTSSTPGAFRRRQRVRRRWSRPALRRHPRLLVAVVARPRLAQQRARGRRGGVLGQLGDHRDDHRFDRGSMPPLSESASKSPCAFPTRSSAAFARASSARRARRGPSTGRSRPAPGSLRGAWLLGQTGRSASITRPPPLDYMGGVQALPAQNRALVPRFGGVVLGDDRQLLSRGERAPPRALRAWAHAPIISGHRVQVRGRHRQRGSFPSSRPVQRE